jgi:hypothetical protein
MLKLIADTRARLWHQGTPFQFLVNGLLEAVWIQFTIEAQAAVDSDQGWSQEAAFDQVKGLARFIVVGDHHVHKLKTYQPWVALFKGLLQLVKLVFMRRNFAAPGGRATGGPSGKGEFVEPRVMEDLDGDHDGLGLLGWMHTADRTLLDKSAWPVPDVTESRSFVNHGADQFLRGFHFLRKAIIQCLWPKKTSC